MNKLKDIVTGFGEMTAIHHANGIVNQTGFDFKFVRNQIGCEYNSKPKDEDDCDFSCPDGFTDPVEFATDVLMAKAAKDTLIAFIGEVLHSIEQCGLTNPRIDWIKERFGIIDLQALVESKSSTAVAYTIKINF